MPFSSTKQSYFYLDKRVGTAEIAISQMASRQFYWEGKEALRTVSMVRNDSSSRKLIVEETVERRSSQHVTRIAHTDTRWHENSKNLLLMLLATYLGGLCRINQKDSHNLFPGWCYNEHRQETNSLLNFSRARKMTCHLPWSRCLERSDFWWFLAFLVTSVNLWFVAINLYFPEIRQKNCSHDIFDSL